MTQMGRVPASATLKASDLTFWRKVATNLPEFDGPAVNLGATTQYFDTGQSISFPCGANALIGVYAEWEMTASAAGPASGIVALDLCGEGIAIPASASSRPLPRLGGYTNVPVNGTAAWAPLNTWELAGGNQRANIIPFFSPTTAAPYVLFGDQAFFRMDGSTGDHTLELVLEYTANTGTTVSASIRNTNVWVMTMEET